MVAVGNLGPIIGLVGVVWVAVIAFQSNDIFWGIFCLICPGIVALIYGVLNFEKAKIPVILIVIGMATGGVARLSSVL